MSNLHNVTKSSSAKGCQVTVYSTEQRREVNRIVEENQRKETVNAVWIIKATI